MMTERFLNFLPFIFKWECVLDRRGNVIVENDPADPGGETKYGIDKRSHPKVDVKNLTREGATEIYWREYWVKNNCETFPAGLGECYFNACVNCGSGRAAKIQHDPAYPHTAAGFLAAQEDFYRRLVAARIESRKAHAGEVEWLKEYPDLSKFLPGWLNRTADLPHFVNA